MNIREKILVVEDEKSIAHFISTVLNNNGYEAMRARTGQEALAMVSSHCPDLIILDLGLPDMDGVDLIRKIRTWSATPIIVISARSEDTDKIEALDAGADDYLTKPFSVDELLARLRVTQRRLNASQGSLPSHIFENGDLKVDFAAGTAYLSGEELSLTPIEYKLLCLFCKNIGKTLTHTYLTDAIWGNTFDSDLASLRVFMASLRKKIEKDTTHPQYIQTRIGVGYRMNRL
jgi:two-component system KDP operon response regulator KdpE